jgi:hypothetical protein
MLLPVACAVHNAAGALAKKLHGYLNQDGDQ